MRKKIFILLFSLSLLISCTTTDIRFGGDAISTNTSHPELNTVTTVSVGDIMLMQGVETKTSAIIIKNDTAHGCVRKGVYKLEGEEPKKGWKLYSPIYSTGANFVSNGMYNAPRYLVVGDYTVIIDQYNNTEKIPNALSCSGFNLYGRLMRFYLIPEEDYEVSSVVLDNAKNFQQTLIYTGRDKNIVKFSYREFDNNNARPAFTIDVQYDLSISKSISFKNANLEIIDATNNSITYKVLKNFN